MVQQLPKLVMVLFDLPEKGRVDRDRMRYQRHEFSPPRKTNAVRASPLLRLTVGLRSRAACNPHANQPAKPVRNRTSKESSAYTTWEAAPTSFQRPQNRLIL